MSAPPYHLAKPLVVCETLAREYMPVNLAPKLLGMKPRPKFGGAFSFMCTLRMEWLTPWARIFDFSHERDKDSITAGVVEGSNDLHFTIFEGRNPVSVRVPGFFDIGRDITLLCTVSSQGHMKVFKDGLLVGDNVNGAIPKEMDRPSMFVGGHFELDDQNFYGAIYDIKLWDQEVSWPSDQQALLDKLGSGFSKPGARLLMEVLEPLDPHDGHLVAQVYAQEDGCREGAGRWANVGKMMLTISTDQGTGSNVSLHLSNTTGAESGASTATPTTGTPHTSSRDSQI